MNAFGPRQNRVDVLSVWPLADIASRQSDVGCMIFHFPADDYCSIHSAIILYMWCDADPLRAVQQQIGAMSGQIVTNAPRHRAS